MLSQYHQYWINHLYFYFQKSIIRVAIYNSLWPDISRFFMVDLIDFYHINLMENMNEAGKERDGPLVFPEYSLHKIPYWDHTVSNKLIVIFY